MHTIPSANTVRLALGNWCQQHLTVASSINQTAKCLLISQQGSSLQAPSFIDVHPTMVQVSKQKSQMRCILLWLLLATLCSCTFPAVTTGTPQPLAPFDYINGQLIDLDTEVKVYRFTGLKPNTGYEVRVSFPASVSTVP